MGFFDGIKEGMKAYSSSEPQAGQMKQLQPYLLPNETVTNVYMNGNDMAALTTNRLLVLDKSIFSGKRVLLGIPFSKITAVGVGQSGTFAFSKEIEVWIGGKSHEVKVPKEEMAIELYHKLSQKIA